MRFPSVRLVPMAILTLLSSVGWSDIGPRMLIAPARKLGSTKETTISIGNYLAHELDEDGRVTPIVWSLTDPIFRQLATSGEVKGSIPDLPTKAEAETIAHGLGATYLAIYSSETISKKVLAKIDVWEGNHLVWHDSKDMSSQSGGTLNGVDTNRSIAHTWALLMLASPFKALAPHPKVVTPTIQKGETPVQVPVSPSPTAEGADVVLAKIDELQKSGNFEKALALSRDAVDSDPFNPKFRLAVVHLYEAQKNWTAAAEAAKRGSEVIPDNLELRTASVQDLIAAGGSGDVKNQLNELMSRDPNSATSLLLQAQTYLQVADYPSASKILDTLVKKSPNPSSYYWRALCRATLGGADGVDEDVQQYLKMPFNGSDLENCCRKSEKILQAATQKDVDLAVNTFQQAAVKPESSDVRDKLDQLQRDATARSNFLQQISASAPNRESYGALLLAQKLLLVSFVSMQDALKSGSDDGMVDARINLGDAIKSLKSSETRLAAESGEKLVAGQNVGLF